MRHALVSLCVAFVAITVVSCAGTPRAPMLGEEFVVERSRDREPSWIEAPTEERGGKIFFNGAATKKTRLEDANTDARMDAVHKVVEHMVDTGLIDYTRAQFEAGIDDSEAALYIEDGTGFLVRSISDGTSEEEIYHERKREWTGSDWKYTHDVYVLISIPSDSLNGMADQAFRQQADQARANNNARAEAFANRLREQLTEDRTAQ